MKTTHQGHRGDLAEGPRVYLLGKMVHVSAAPTLGVGAGAGLQAALWGKLFQAG